MSHLCPVDSAGQHHTWPDTPTIQHCHKTNSTKQSREFCLKKHQEFHIPQKIFACGAVVHRRLAAKVTSKIHIPKFQSEFSCPKNSDNLSDCNNYRK